MAQLRIFSRAIAIEQIGQTFFYTNRKITMIARVTIPIPFSILIAVDEKLQPFCIEDSGYKISFFPPKRDPDLVSQIEPSIIKLQEKDAYLCNFIMIDFQKEEFNRVISIDSDKMYNFEPSIDLINKVVNDFFIRLRYLNNITHIHIIDLNYSRWRITYLNDDKTELTEEKGKIRGRGTQKFKIKYAPLNSEIWNDIFKLPSDFYSQNWSDLLLDGLDELPEIGPSIILTFTALEVFIAKTLNQLATKDKISLELWTWINKRPDLTQNPSVEEQYDILLKVLTGYSLKDDEKLWSTFKNLKTARNAFVHEGVARISRNSKPLNKNEARNLIILANEIPFKIREWLPKDIQWDLKKNYDTTAYFAWPLDRQKTDKVVKRGLFPLPPSE